MVLVWLVSGIFIMTFSEMKKSNWPMDDHPAKKDSNIWQLMVTIAISRAIVKSNTTIPVTMIMTQTIINKANMATTSITCLIALAIVACSNISEISRYYDFLLLITHITNIYIYITLW